MNDLTVVGWECARTYPFGTGSVPLNGIVEERKNGATTKNAVCL